MPNNLNCRGGLDPSFKGTSVYLGSSDDRETVLSTINGPDTTPDCVHISAVPGVLSGPLSRFSAVLLPLTTPVLRVEGSVGSFASGPLAGGSPALGMCYESEGRACPVRFLVGYGL